MKRGRGWERVTIDTQAAEPGSDPVDLLALDEAMTRLGALSERQARVVELRFFGGLTVPETAAVLGVSARTVKGEWRVARAWLGRELRWGANR